MTTYAWDRTLLMPGEVEGPFAAPNNVSGGVSLDGVEQVVGNSPGRLQIRFSQIAVNTAAKVRRWQEIAARVDGRLTPLLVPALDRQRAPSPSVTAVMVGAVAPGDVACSIRVNSGGGALLAGMHWSVGERLYRISEIVSVTDYGTHKVYAVKFRLPCREAIADAAALEFNDPWFRVRLASDDAMRLTLNALRFGTGTVDFVEDLS